MRTLKNKSFKRNKTFRKLKGGLNDKSLVYLINLDDRKDRLEKVQNYLKDLPFNVERVSAIKHTDGLIGCTLSHVSIIKKAKEQNLQYVIVMEDDFYPTKDFNSVWPLIKNYLESHMDAWDIYLGGNSLYGLTDDKSTIKPLCKINDTLKLYYTEQSTSHFIIYNSSIYDKFIEVEQYLKEDVFDRSKHGVDRWPAYNKMKIVSSIPFIAIQESSYSNIIKEETNYDDLFTNSANLISSVENSINCSQNGGGKSIKTYVLNLDKRKDRWDAIQEKFKNSNLELERVSAIENETGYIGCGLSHIEAIKKAKEKNQPYAIILEDDCIPTEHFNNFTLVLDWLAKHLELWDVFVGGNSYHYFHDDKQSIEPLCKINDTCKLYKSKIQSAHFVIYNTSVYDRIINEWEQSQAIDLLANKLNLKSICVAPFIAIQSKSFSDIENYEVDRSDNFKKSEDVLLSIENKSICKTKAYVINLDERKERWTQIQQDYSPTSIELERFSAIKDANGHIGAGKSFQALVQQAKDNNFDSILIMEDDCKPLKFFEKRWQIVKQWLDTNRTKWSIFNGGPITPMGTKLVESIDDKNKIYTSDGASALHFLLVSNDAYDTILKWNFDKDHLIDWYINREKNKYVYVDPPLALQHSGKSDTDNKNKNFNDNSNDQAVYSKTKIEEVNKLYDGGSGKKILINYADKGFINSRKKLKASALSIGGLDEVIEYGLNDIDDEFKKKNKKHFDNTRGAGLWLWKPYLILKTLKTIDTSNILVYCDAGAEFTGSIQPYIDKMKGSIMLFYAPYSSWSSNEYTKMNIYKKLDCMDNKNVTHGTQIEGGFMILKKSNESIEFISKWLEMCEDYHLISDEPSIEPNFPEFNEHRHDQSILSALGKLYKEKYNIDIENKPFINHHRKHDGGKRKTRKTRKKQKGGNLYNLYCFWTGTNVMSDKRKSNFDTLKNTKLNVILVTPDNLNKYIKEPLHDGYQYLSETHKADYLRTYFMHFIGGGYSDIKETKESWLPYVKLLETDPNLWCIGYKEVSNGVPQIGDDIELTNKLRNDYEKLIGNGAYIFKPNTLLTNEWYSTMMKVMDSKLENLKKYPARNTEDVYSEEYPYPLRWTELLGEIFHPTIYKYLDHINNSLPPPDFFNYR